MRVDILTEEGCEAAADIDRLADSHPLIRVITVPKDYVPANGTRFKARANHYAHELRIEEGEALDYVWVLHMDDDTGVGPDTASSLAQFINRQRRAHPDEAKHMAQGILTYPRENAANLFTWLADAVRPADDIARFRALTGMGTPAAGVHGELLVLRASIEATIGWDFGPKEIVEDARLALTFCRRYPGRSDWFNGRCYGASPPARRTSSSSASGGPGDWWRSASTGPCPCATAGSSPSAWPPGSSARSSTSPPCCSWAGSSTT